MAWAFADTRTERVPWGAWRAPQDLLSLDLTADTPGEASAAGPQRLVLVCTNGKRDQCCALRGRPVRRPSPPPAGTRGSARTSAATASRRP